MAEAMELRHLRYFVTVAEALSFTKAAEQLRIAQPALSRQVQDLEDEIAAEPIIGLRHEDNPSYHHVLDRLFGPLGTRPRIALECDGRVISAKILFMAVLALGCGLVCPQILSAETRTVLLELKTEAGVQTYHLPGNGEFTEAGGRWTCQTVKSPVKGREGCEEITVMVKLLEGTANAASVSYACEFADWDSAGYVLVPSAVYAGNRFNVLPAGYPPLWRKKEQFRKDMPVMITDQPRLDKGGRPGKIELDTGSAATPAMGFRSTAGRGFLLLTRQQCEFGNLGMTIEEIPAEHRLRLLVTAPRSRSKIANMMGFRKGDPSRDWNAGDTVTIRVRLWNFKAPALQTLFDRFAECRKDMEPSQPRNECPFSEAWKLLEGKYNTENWSEELGFYCHGEPTDQSKREHLYAFWQLGWVTGGLNTQANLLQGNEISRDRALRTLDFMFTKTPAKSGFWYGSSDGKNFYGDAFAEPHPFNLSMVRKQADGLAAGVKQLQLLREQKAAVSPAWEASARNLADAMVRLWDKNGQLGQFIDVETGEILVGNSTAGAHVPAGLVRAAAYFNEPRYLEKAQEIGRHFVTNALRTGITCGGPGEALAAPDSETAFALLESFVELHEATGNAEWAAAARDMTRQCATWVVSYDYHFPPNSALGVIQARSTGAVWANVQNKHGAPGMCTLSGDCLFKLWRATGDEFALELIRDIAHGMPQYLCRPDRPVGSIKPGWMCERVNLCDWEGPNNVGGNINFAAPWAETALMLTTAEIPGVYANTKTKRVVVFDHVEARIEGGELVIHNPTTYDATVKVLIENKTEAKRPLGVWTLKNARRVAVPADGTVKVALSPKSK